MDMHPDRLQAANRAERPKFSGGSGQPVSWLDACLVLFAVGLLILWLANVISGMTVLIVLGSVAGLWAIILVLSVTLGLLRGMNMVLQQNQKLTTEVASLRGEVARLSRHHHHERP